MVNFTTTSTLDPLVDSGELDEALEVAADLAERLENEDVLALAFVRAAQARILAVRGQAAQVVAALEGLESTSRVEGSADYAVIGLLGASAVSYAAIAQDDRALALLAELEATPDARESLYYATLLPAMARTALGIGDRELAERLVGGLEARSPYAEHALLAANAALTEVRGDLRAAADAYADAADRWERFGVVTEQAFALLGRGRCLVGLARPTEAAHPLREAREIFERLGAAPALAETDALLQQATALSS
jgi:ATP/maltotriose-dependent transcriptional regulator MalT